MAVACIILAVIAALGTGLAFYYRCQIKNVKSQISFLNQHETNMLITSDKKSGCVAELADELNTLLEQTAALRKEIADNESHLKDTVINLSHDIRTPLTSMDGYFQLLLKSDDPEERQRYATVISDRLSSLKEMLDELFTYAKLTNRAYEVVLSSCAVNEILLSVLFSFYKDIKQRGIEPLIDVPEQDVFIQGNEPALRRIFQNILRNCIEHGNEHLSVCLINLVETVQISFENDYQMQEPIDINKVFDRFYKADEARSKTSTGLGLSIAKELVERLNGSIAGTVQDGRFIITTTFYTEKSNS
ncbi:HAMP domain-containing histidine kinase [Faecalimonas umbilicata]|nr:HAMP domain-containing histidine kinase [Faecalimonas umbilicata]